MLAQSVQQGVGGLVRDDVVRQAAEDRAGAAGEVSEEEPLVPAGVEGVGVGEGVRGDLDLVAAEAPRDPAAEGPFRIAPG